MQIFRLDDFLQVGCYPYHSANEYQTCLENNVSTLCLMQCTEIITNLLYRLQNLQFHELHVQ